MCGGVKGLSSPGLAGLAGQTPGPLAGSPAPATLRPDLRPAVGPFAPKTWPSTGFPWLSLTLQQETQGAELVLTDAFLQGRREKTESSVSPEAQME